MGTLKIDTDEKVLARFRRKAMKAYGYKRGSLKAATENLIKKWISSDKIDWSALRGSIKSGENSVELQHKAWRKVD
ncbi:MAG: hypothetical protein HYX24_01515 [Candidatus Aenigmarchaeota archaeon]|nr:hypothetical protein [Candidatus Aenigmarchaeota archaeon]